MASKRNAHLHANSVDSSESDDCLSSDFESPTKNKEQVSAAGPNINKPACLKFTSELDASKSVTSTAKGSISKKNPITCKFCKKTFSSYPSVSRHRKICQLNPVQNDSTHKCAVCGRQFSRQYVYLAHIKGCKPAAPHQAALKKTKCPIPGCDKDFLFKSSIHEHLIQFHKRSDVKELTIHSFKSFEEFEKWKTTIEDRNFTFYSQQYGKRNGRLYYYCQKDGENRCHDKGPRKTDRRNSKGSVKKNQLCLSMMAVTCESDGKCNVRFYPSHCHKCLARDLKFQPLSSETNEFIRRQLAWNVPPRKIVENLRDDSYKRENRWQKRVLKRDNIVKIKTVAERRRKMNMKKRYANDDATSVSMKAQVLMKESYNPILIYKPQGKKLVSGPAGAENLPDETFLFGIQTQEQMEMMKKHSKVILAMDETHGTNQNGFKLLNLVVKDEFNLGYPVGHLITSCSLETTLQYFFRAIKDRCPDISINCCITDGDLALINSLVAGFGGEDIWHILCIWHIHRNVQTNLREHVKDSQLVEEMYQVLCLIIDARTEEDFNKLVQAFLLEFGHVSSTYKKYFETKFLPKAQKWAMCFRKEAHGGVETTMLVESFHNILKSVYLRRIPNRRVDDLIDLLLQIEEDYFVRHNNAIQLETLWPNDVRKIKERHGRSLKILDGDVSKVSSQCYFVKSQEKDSENEEYKVVRCLEKCDEPACIYNCPSCEICSHLYLCTCPDTIPLCKHIHKVHLMYFSCEASPDNPVVDQEPEFFVGDNIAESCLESTENIRNNSDFTVEKKLDKIKGIMKEVEDQLENSPVKKFMLSRIQNVLSDLHCQCKALTDNKIRETQVPEMAKTINIYPNEKLQVQPVNPFKRVKKTKKDKSLKKPNRKSAEEIRKFLFQAEDDLDVDNEGDVDDVNSLVLDGDNENNNDDVGTSAMDYNENGTYNNLNIGQNLPKLSDDRTIDRFFKVLADNEDSLYACSCNKSVAEQLCKESLQNILAILVPTKLDIGWIVAAVCISFQEIWYFNPLAKPNSNYCPSEMKFLSCLASSVRPLIPAVKHWKIKRHFDYQDTTNTDSAVFICWFGYNISVKEKWPVPHLPDVGACRNEINDAISM